MLAIVDIFKLSPEFENAVLNVHNVTMPVALVVCFAGLTMATVRAQQERSLNSIWPDLLRIFLVSVVLCDLPGIGNWLETMVIDIEQAAGVGNGSAFSDYIAALKQKFGVDLSALDSVVPPGPYSSATGTGTTSETTGTTVSTYGYEQPGDSTYDSKSAQGIGAFPFDSASGSLVPGQSLALSPNLTAGLTPGQQVTVNLANGQSISGIYADKTADSFNGQTLSRVDIYDPNQQYSSLTGVAVTSINGSVPTRNGGNPVNNFFNGLMHPVETAAIGIFGMIVLFISFVAVFIMWIVALLQSVLFYSEIAVAPLFAGFLLVRGFENIAKGFLLSFVAICFWPIAFLITGLVTKFIISMGVNTGNSAGVGVANAFGMTYFWIIGLAVWVIFSSIAGPWIISKRVVAGASGLADMVVGAHSAAGKVYNFGQSTVSKAAGAPVSIASSTITPHENYARRPAAKGSTNGETS